MLHYSLILIIYCVYPFLNLDIFENFLIFPYPKFQNIILILAKETSPWKQLKAPLEEIFDLKKEWDIEGKKESRGGERERIKKR